MSSPAISIENLGKRYRYGGVAPLGYDLRSDIADWFKRLFNRQTHPTFPIQHSASNVQHPASKETAEKRSGISREYFWALKDINLEVKQGEVVGIIGRNGAGKSTLLKILARITAPTTGRVTYNGRVASLLEVGAGFHRELTGRENVFLNGSILGMKRREIARKFDEIVAFAEVEKFIDTPVKFYSSGMYVRLAFAVAAHLEPEILLVDEVLAVGDTAFQKKCLGKMEDVAAAGRTVLFVSHNMGAVRSLTQRCLYLKDGKTEALGPTDAVVQRYLSDTFGYEGTQRPPLDRYHREAVGDSPVRFTRVWVNDAPDEIPLLDMGEKFTVNLELENSIELRGGLIGIELKKKDGTRVTSLLCADKDFRIFAAPGKHVVRCAVDGLPTTPGDYIATIGINQSDGTRAWDVLLDYPLFRVADRAGKVVHWSHRPWGAVHWDGASWSVV